MDFADFSPLWFLLVLLPLGWLTWKKSLVDRLPALKWLAHGLRAFGVLLLVLALCRPFMTLEREEMHLICLVDVSESVDVEEIRSVMEEVEKAQSGLKSGDRFSLVRFANGLDQCEMEELRELLKNVEEGRVDSSERGASRLAKALLGTRLLFEGGLSKRLVVFSDGVSTEMGVGEALRALSEESVDVRFRSMDGIRKPEAAMVSFEPLTQVAYRGEVVRMKMRMKANESMNARARVLNRGVVVAESPVTLKANEEAEVVVDVPMATPGESRWEAELIADRDWFPVNNKVSTTITVRGEPRILILHRDEKQMRPFARAMKKQGLEVEVRGERGMPESMGDLLAFDAVVLADVPATSMTVNQMAMLRRYAADFGGGVGMFGSDNSFGLGGYYQTPVEEVLPLTSRYEKEKQKPSLAMVLVIDKSGSMSGGPMALARASAKAAAELLGVQDQIGVVGFDSSAQTILEMTSAADQGTVINAIETLSAGGGTDAYPAMAAGRDMLRRTVAKVKHMIVLSDGQTSGNDYGGLAREMRNMGITVSTVALGQGADHGLMQMIAQEGGGRYYETNDPQNMPQIFTKETMKASRSAIKEDLFGAVVTGDHPVLSGYEDSDLPFVLGYVMTKAKPTANLLLAAETGDPLLAVSRYGLGMGLAFTSDLSERWGSEWLTWGRGPSFWAQVLRGMLRKEQAAGLSVTGRVLGERWKFDLVRRDELDQPVDRVRWAAKALDSEGRELPFQIRQVGVGRYEGEVDLSGAESATVSVRDVDFGLGKTMDWERSYPAEYLLDRELSEGMNSLASFDPELPRGDLKKANAYRDVSHWFVFFAFAFVLAGLVLRRI